MNLDLEKIIKSDEILTQIANNFEGELYLVGGAVRDFFCGKMDFNAIEFVFLANLTIFSTSYSHSVKEIALQSSHFWQPMQFSCITL